MASPAFAALVTPESVTDVHRNLWRDRGRAVGATYEVTPCTYSEQELAALSVAGRRVGFMPEALAAQDTRPLLDQMFPDMQSYSLLEHNPVTNDDDAFGWFDYDADIDAPYTETDEEQLLAQLQADGRRLLSLNQYIVASQDTRAFTGHHLDERRTWTRVGSRLDGRLLAARFDGPDMAEGLLDEDPVDGSLLVAYDLGANDRGIMLGARSYGGAIPAPRRSRADADDRRPRPVEVRVVDLQSEWQRQTDLYVQFGFHRELGMTRDAYISSLPRFEPQPAAYRGRLDLLLLIETRLDWRRQAGLAGIALSGGSRDTVYDAVDARSATPARPYVGWFNAWGDRFPDPIGPPEARSQLADDEVGATVVELAAIEIAHPCFSMNANYFEAIGQVRPHSSIAGFASAVEHERSPCFYRWRGRAEIGSNLHPIAYSIFRPLIRGSRISTSSPD